MSTIRASVTISVTHPDGTSSSVTMDAPLARVLDNPSWLVHEAETPVAQASEMALQALQGVYGDHRQSA